MRIVSRFAFAIVLTAIMLLTIKCHKDKVEEPLRATIDALPMNTIVGPDFNFNLMVQSKMPPSGVNIEYNVKGELDQHLYFNDQKETTTNNTPLRIPNLPRQIVCLCTVVVTSKTLSTNKTSLSFRVGYK